MSAFFVTYQVFLHTLYLSCALTGCFLVRRSWPLSYRLLVALSCLTVVVELVVLYCSLRRINYAAIYNAWAYFEVSTIIYIQFREVAHTWAKRLLTLLLVLLSATTVVFYCMMPAHPRLSGHFLMFFLFPQLIATCAALVDILQDTSPAPLSARPAVWLATGMLFYSSIFLVLHIWGFFFTNEANKSFYFFSIPANACMYGGFIATFIKLRYNPGINKDNNL